jgi:hypothetical protein
MNERDAARAQPEALHQAGQETGDERRATRMDRTLQRYLAGAYSAILSRGTSRRRGDGSAHRKP